MTAATARRDYALDPLLVGAVVGLVALGAVMVGSASMPYADQKFGEPFHYLVRHLAALVVGGAALAAAVVVPIDTWRRVSAVLMAVALVLLALVLVPALGRTVNGSARWLELGPLSVQASEPARLFLLIYIASYAVRHGTALAASFKAFVWPMAVIAGAGALLLCEPDFGATAVLLATSLGLLYVGGARLREVLLAVGVGGAGLYALARLSPEHSERMLSFLRPWDHELEGGYQLVQALMAIGRGEWLGVGLGESVQKLFYLPEAHTDFIFAVLAEELGFAGVTLVIVLFGVLLYRAFAMGQQALREGLPFHGLLAIGIALMLGLGCLINIGVNAGALPTKGLALPLMSYGRSSIVTTLLAIGVLVRIHHELNGKQERLVQKGQVR